MKWNLLAVIAFPLVLTFGCASDQMAHSTRTGKIHDVKVGQMMSPESLTVRPGDEVRWINTRSATVRIVFVDTIKDRVSCQNGFKFGGLKGMFSDEATHMRETTIEPNEYASLCFSEPGTYTYNSRMVANTPGGEATSVGKVMVDRAE